MRQACWTPASGAWAARLCQAGPTPDGTEATEDIMADFRPYQVPNATTGARADAAIDQGLRAYMLKVYNLMAMGLVITGLAAWGAFQLAVSDDLWSWARHPEMTS